MRVRLFKRLGPLKCSKIYLIVRPTLGAMGVVETVRIVVEKLSDLDVVETQLVAVLVLLA